MLTETDEEQQQHRSASKRIQRRSNPTPCVTPSDDKPGKVSETPELLKARRRKNRSPTLNRADKANKDEIKYQRFVNHLRRDIQFYLNQCLQESRFDPRGNQCLRLNSSLVNSRMSLRPKRHVSSTLSMANDGETLISSTRTIGHDPMSLLTNNEKKRLTGDVQTILNGPALKNFYSHFIRHPQERTTSSFSLPPLRPLADEALLWINEQE